MNIKRFNGLLWFGLLLCAAGFIVFFLMRPVRLQAPAAVHLKKADVERSLLLRGRLEPWDEAEVSADIAGRIRGSVPELGQRVDANQKLVEIEADAQYVAGVREALTLYQAAEKELQQIERLAITPSIKGIVADLMVAAGQQVHAGQPLLTITPPGAAPVSVKAPAEGCIQRILARPGAEVSPGDALPLMYIAPRKVRMGASGQVGAGELIRRFIDTQHAVKNLELQAHRAYIDSEVPIELAYVVAPMKGVVSWRAPHLGTGALIAGKQPLVKIASERRIVTCKVHEVDYPKIHTGQQVVIRFDAYPDLKILGKLIEKDQSPDQSVFDQYSEYRVRFSLDRDSDVLVLGMSANLWITLESRHGVPTLPLSALLRDGDLASAVLVEDDDFIRVPVKLGLVGGDRAEILGGLDARDAVVLYPYRLSPLPALPDGAAPAARHTP
jgi:multidrug efflux pump subunit AcrA (membrane-fusion protein)